jgi:hypothetical protein
MRTLSGSLVVVLLLACQGKEGKAIDPAVGSSTTTTTTTTTTPPTGGGSDIHKALELLESYRSKMCACEDVPCTEAVFKDFTAWRLEFRKGIATRPKPTKEQDKKGNDLNRALMACKSNVTAKAGKGSGSAAAPTDPIEASLAELDTFKTKMCACKDKTCADALQKEYAEWNRNLRIKLIEKPNKLQEVRGNALQKEMQECRKKAETGTPGAPGGTTKIDNFLTQMQGYKDKICACTAKDCALTLQKELETWLVAAAKDIADAKPTKDQDDKADRLEREMKDCVGNLK